MTRFRLTVEYDGRPFQGWQRQAHGPTVQAAIEQAIHDITGEQVTVHAAGRTDAGVHARAMPAHVDIAKIMPADRLMGGINARLRPHPVAILACEAVAPDWHARFSCIERSYAYHIVNRRAPLTLSAGQAWHVAASLNAAAMHDAAQQLVGVHDFTTFRSAHCQAHSPLRTLDRLDVERDGECITIRAVARSFLHHQVRSMVGCLMLVGRGKWRAADLRAALDARDRSALGFNAPPDGLFFLAARYPKLERRDSAVVLSPALEQESMMGVVKDDQGATIDFAEACKLMDPDLRTEILRDTTGDEQARFDAYAQAHAERFGQPFPPFSGGRP